MTLSQFAWKEKKEIFIYLFIYLFKKPWPWGGC
jgi:hypothetical protein